MPSDCTLFFLWHYLHLPDRQAPPVIGPPLFSKGTLPPRELLSCSWLLPWSAERPGTAYQSFCRGLASFPLCLSAGATSARHLLVRSETRCRRLWPTSWATTAPGCLSCRRSRRHRRSLWRRSGPAKGGRDISDHRSPCSGESPREEKRGNEWLEGPKARRSRTPRTNSSSAQAPGSFDRFCHGHHFADPEQKLAEWKKCRNPQVSAAVAPRGQ